MFKEIENRLDEILDLPEDYFILGEVIAYLTEIPLWKVAVFYVYTFTYIRQREQGKEFRTCVKCMALPYKLRYKVAVSRLRSWL